MNHTRKIRIGTRGSQLALWQAQYVANILLKADLHTEIVVIETKGDKLLHQPLASIGTKGLFTEELETQLRLRAIDIAVHSAKDMPSQIADDLEIIAFTEREKPHDVLLSLDKNFTLQNNPDCVVGTSSVRRKAILKSIYPHITIEEARGNLQTRFHKLECGKFQAMILAYAGVHRMQLDKYIVREFSVHEFIPPVGQGSIAVQCFAELDYKLKYNIKQAVNHFSTEICLLTERAFLSKLGGGCSIPAFAYATPLTDDTVKIYGGIIHPHGHSKIVHEMVGEKITAGIQLAEWLLRNGAKQILEYIHHH
ncbi:MAG: hydroxymethylbilane synthase [Cytophagaceae bacterium]|nr:hydroxymethylbilane synthase [Cytophagaceae bacterium]MDW8455575.1 hydroxymethylbilane synthase [Cytophagaceae bacterium]